MEVTFSEVVGMEELNDGRPRKVKNCKVRQYNSVVVKLMPCLRTQYIEYACQQSHSVL